MTMNKWLAITVGTLFIGASSFGFYAFTSSYEQKMTTMTTYTPVKLIPAGELITREMIQEVTIPKAKHFDGALLEPESIIGKRALVPIGEQEEFLPWKLNEKKIVPTGDEQLISFPINFVESANNFIRRGDEVTIWAEYNRSPRITYFDANGQKMPFTFEEIHSNLLGDVSHYTKKVDYVEKLVEKVTVTNVKDNTGREVRDQEASTDTLNQLKRITPVQRDSYYMENFRMKPTGTPANITLMLTPEQYSKIVEAQTFQATIKVGVGNPYGDLSNLANLPVLNPIPSSQQTEKAVDKQASNEKQQAPAEKK
ncbi:hypothetical protein ABE38_24650 [Brevibacillus agri]|nr:hypothetical protein [Brevibacillus agri]